MNWILPAVVAVSVCAAVSAQREGSCPVGTVGQSCVGFQRCNTDYDCSGNKKCCDDVNCDYKTCRAPQEPKICTLIGCISDTRPDCKNERFIQPNGPECPPICRVCDDDVDKPGECPVGTIGQSCRGFRRCSSDRDCSGDEKCCDDVNCSYKTCRKPREPRACTKIGCSDTAGPDCQNVRLIQPNGPECPPICRVCDDDVDKPGRCPVGTIGQSCRGFRRCRSDGDCSGKQKCCDDVNCSYKTCRDPAQPRICTRIGCQDSASPSCKKVGFIQPNGPECPPICTVCNDRPANKPGQCPVGTVGQSCRGFKRCRSDSQCPRDEKCCEDVNCGKRKTCRKPREPRICTEIGCVDTAQPGCTNVGLIQPNGPECEPICKVCNDDNLLSYRDELINVWGN